MVFSRIRWFSWKEFIVLHSKKWRELQREVQTQFTLSVRLATCCMMWVGLLGCQFQMVTDGVVECSPPFLNAGKCRGRGVQVLFNHFTLQLQYTGALKWPFGSFDVYEVLKVLVPSQCMTWGRWLSALPRCGEATHGIDREAEHGAAKRHRRHNTFLPP